MVDTIRVFATVPDSQALQRSCGPPDRTTVRGPRLTWFHSHGLRINCEMKGCGATVWLECSLPRLFKGHNIVPLTEAETLAALVQFEALTEAILGLKTDLKLCRVDWVTDFVLQPERVQSLMFVIRMTWMKKEKEHVHYIEGVEGDGILVRGASYEITAYDKRAEVNQRKPWNRGQRIDRSLALSLSAGRVRLECRYMRPAFARGCLKDFDTVQDLRAGLRSAFDRCTADKIQKMQSLIESDELSSTEIRERLATHFQGVPGPRDRVRKLMSIYLAIRHAGIAEFMSGTGLTPIQVMDYAAVFRQVGVELVQRS